MAEKRLIYAEDLFDPVDCSVLMLHKGGQRSGKTMAMYEEIFRKRAELAPTIDAAPVVHGRWIAVPSSDMMTGKAYKCSECQKMRYGSFMPNYCPHCGAKMDM